jgi:hypothetical protein
MRMYYLHTILVLFFQVKSIPDILEVEKFSFVARKEAYLFILVNQVVLDSVLELEIIYCIRSVMSCVKINQIISVTINCCHFNNDVNKYFNISKAIS